MEQPSGFCRLTLHRQGGKDPCMLARADYKAAAPWHSLRSTNTPGARVS